MDTLLIALIFVTFCLALMKSFLNFDDALTQKARDMKRRKIQADLDKERRKRERLPRHAYIGEGRYQENWY